MDWTRSWSANPSDTSNFSNNIDYAFDGTYTIPYFGGSYAWEENHQQSANTTSTLPIDLSIEFDDPQVVTEYRLWPYDLASTLALPKEFKLQASSNNSTWVDLDHQTNQTFTRQIGGGVVNSYSVSNTTAYQYYRLLVISVKTSGTNWVNRYVRMQELEFIGYAPQDSSSSSQSSSSSSSQSSSSSSSQSSSSSSQSSSSPSGGGAQLCYSNGSPDDNGTYTANGTYNGVTKYEATINGNYRVIYYGNPDATDNKWWLGDATSGGGATIDSSQCINDPNDPVSCGWGVGSMASGAC